MFKQFEYGGKEQSVVLNSANGFNYANSTTFKNNFNLKHQTFHFQQNNLNNNPYLSNYSYEHQQNIQKKYLLNSFLDQIDHQNNSQDQGIEDYHIGGYHPVFIGQILIGRYLVIQKLGWGHFSTVWLCKDFKFHNYVAVKIIKSAPHHMEAAFDEVQILQKVEKCVNHAQWQGSTRAQTHVINMLNSFVHKTMYGDHFCMVFEILSCNLLEIMKKYNYQGIPLQLCRQIAIQCLKGLDFLHRICHVIHTDLKPQNVMVSLSINQIHQIVQNGQLKKDELFNERIKRFQEYLGISKAIQQLELVIQNQTKEEKQTEIKVLQDNNKNKTEMKIDYNSEQWKNLSTKQKKNKKKKLKKKMKKQQNKQNSKNIDIENTQSQTKETFQQNTNNQQVHLNNDNNNSKSTGNFKFNKKNILDYPFTVKIADLGNGCWFHHHFSSQIQTRQYRSPQVLIGCKYDATADIWSFACMLFQLITGQLLFQPRKGDNWNKTQDHIAQIIELLGPLEESFVFRGKKSKKYFTKNGTMKNIPLFEPLMIERLLIEKYKMRIQQGQELAQFLRFMLVPEPQLRPSAQQCLKHPWLYKKNQLNDMCRLSPKQYQIIMMKSKLQLGYMEKAYYRNENFTADGQDNDGEISQDDEDILQFKQGKKRVNIRLIDRSFTDLGYIGFSEGIAVQELDSQPNWQFA